MRAKRTLVAYAAAADGKDRNNPYKGIRQIGAILHAKAVSATAGRVCD